MSKIERFKGHLLSMGIDRPVAGQKDLNTIAQTINQIGDKLNEVIDHLNTRADNQ